MKEIRELNVDPIDETTSNYLMSAICQKLHSEDAKVLLLTQCVQNGVFTVEMFEDARKCALYFSQQADLEQLARAKEQEKLRLERDKPDSKYSDLYNNRALDFYSLKNWIKRTSTKELEEYLAKLNENPYHYASLFPAVKGGVGGAIETLQKLIAEKKVNEKSPNLLAKIKG